MNINPNILIDCIEEAGFEPRSYSGRGMYGKVCVGVDLDRSVSPFELGVKLCLAALSILDEEEARTFIDRMADIHACGDGMGLGSITYWPSVKWPEDLEDEDDSEDDFDEPGHEQANEP